ncbi:gasdermin-D [Aotus nancymaae]|uniref:Gasdermin D n=1 Tax=Aotus nancymaae TaxID=37293 RepID=A0A2K5C516_AOTNA|nr:gasdermin-D [Aotus nancymaae]XP_012316655.1 gasdermin-D [Aotus nancymaae]XP_021527750.1 gasdermin-D [Aotus nancymaae]
MGSAFEWLVRRVVQELDHGGALIPVTSLQSSTAFKPYCLVVRKPARSWFWKPRYQHVNLSIKDILEPDAPEPVLQHDGPFHIHDTVDGQLRTSVEVAAPGEGKVAGGASVSDSSSTSLNVFSLSVGPNTWQALLQERHLRQPEHGVLQQLRCRGDNVYVVTEVLQTQKEVEVMRTHRQEGWGLLSLAGAMCLQGEGEGHLSQKKTVTIPSGSILAFRVALLVIHSDLEVILFPDKKQKTFQPPPTGYRPFSSEGSGRMDLSMRGCIGNFQTDGVPANETVTEDFQGLQAEVEAVSKELALMDGQLCQQLLEGLERVLRDQLALQALEEALEQGLSSGPVEPLGGLADAVLDCLVSPSRMLVPELAVPVVYLLGALNTLSKAQHQLLVEAVALKTLSRQLELVGSLLEKSAPWQKRSTLSLPPELLKSGWGGETPAWILLEECGLELREDPPHVHWEPQAQGRVCALYASLALLSQLSQEPR